VPECTFTIERRGHDVVLAIRGHFTAEAAEQSTAQFKNIVGVDRVRLVVDFGGMTGYDREARTLWQQVLAPLRKQIAMLVFIGDAPPLVKMAASAVALAIGVRMKFAQRLEDVPQPSRQTLADDGEEDPDG
jgi:predicted membrane chloride channel (bestrophin family)